MSYAHPPLANVIATIPAALDGALGDITSLPAYRDASIIPLYEQYFSIDYERARHQLMMSRAMMMLFPVLLVSYVYYFVDEFFNRRTAVVAAALIVFNPTLLAHGRLVTTDYPAALGYAMAIGEFVRFVSNGWRWKQLLRFSLALAFAILVKHNGLLLLPAFMLLALGFSWRRTTGAARFRARFGRILVDVGGRAFVVLAVLLVSVNAAYRFQRTAWTVEQILDEPEPKYWISRPYDDELLERWTLLDELPVSQVRLPVPYPYLFGVACIAAQNARGWPRSYFMGSQGHRHGTWSYFPTLLLIKNPAGVVLLFLFGIAMTIRGAGNRWDTPRFVLATILGYFILMIARSNLNMGVRHALPAVPLVTILAADWFWAFWERAKRETAKREIRSFGLLLLLVTIPIETIVAVPRYLGFFNFLVGRNLGHQISIIGEDWGQDLYRFAKFVEDKQIAPLYYVEHTRVNRAELQWLNVKYTNLRCHDRPRPGSWAAIRAAVQKTRRPDCHTWTEGRSPEHVVNYHILLYRIEEDPGAGSKLAD